ncbi:major facilitator superfamily multidrug-resistance, DHA1 sub-family [Dendrothele bispora CBS 962.96]|uniref:Major facilitator superfamily multidrug-resistance, DHA1 sub-family n=1 Tax=Dendrothele bispora (strain CBS 962.96) TaxID=1314807 RepID=A0A4S8MXR8_DENBC|nr:major facilitator superfamily multidrug-resistance, DHA1 sub-family [Dendrothele bispora CBS 962.96]
MTATTDTSQDQHDEENQPSRKRRRARTPLLYPQLATLCFLRILDPLNFTQIFPYINQLIADLGVAQDETKIGWYSGMVESAFALCQLIAIYPWAIASDGYGRRPVIIAGAFGLTIATLAFGFSQSFLGVLGARAMAGLFSGNVAVIPSVLCQITDSTNQSFAFSFFGLWWPFGSIIGPLIGGFFSNPVTNFPDQFGDSILFREYPYLLPCLLIAGMNCLGLVFSYFFLKETNQKANEPGLQDKHLCTRDLLSIPIIRTISESAFFLSFISTAFDVVFVLFCYSPIHSGGLALSVEGIGYALAISGGISAAFQLFFMPILLERLDHTKFYHFCMTIWPYVFLSMPLLNVFARWGVDPNGETVDIANLGLLWAGIITVLFAARVATLPYSINMLLVKRYTPAPSALGSVTGLVQFFICLSRALSPMLTSWAFTISVDIEIFGGYLWAFLIAVISLKGSMLSKRIVEEASKLR